MGKKELKRYIIIGIIAVGVCAVVKNIDIIFNFIGLVFSAAYPLILGFIIAYIFNIFLSFCERHYFPKKNTKFITKTRRPVCLVMSIAITVAVIALILIIVIPELVKALKIIYQEIPGYAQKLKNFAIEYLRDYPTIQQKIRDINIDWDTVMEKVTNFITVGAGGRLISSIAEVIGSVTMSIVNFFIGMIFAVYVLLRKDKLRVDFGRAKDALLSKKINRRLTNVIHTADETFRSFFVGQFTEAIILGTLCMIGMAILRIPYAAMTGAVIGVTALIPIIGAYIGAAVGAFMISTDDPKKALIFLIFLILLQQFEGNVIYPKVVGSSVGLPGIWVLAAVTFGGGLFGITGMLIGVPTVATLYKLCHAKLDELDGGGPEAAVATTGPGTEAGTAGAEEDPGETKPGENAEETGKTETETETGTQIKTK